MAELSPDEQLADLLASCYADPLKYVMLIFPWDSNPDIQVVKLAEKYRDRFPNCEYGPDEWACEFLDQLGDEIRKRNFDGRTPVDAIRFATVSGHEIGKSCIVAWLIKFILDTRPFSKGSVTATTDEQLRTKTWAELGKWHAISLTKHWFDFNSGRGNMSMAHSNPDYAGTWRCDAKTCRAEKSEAFAGQHAPTATSFYIFDEASGVPNEPFEVREGGLSSGEPMVFDFGNGTRNSGMFFENCMGRFKHRYIVRSIDSRTVAITNKAKIAQDAADYGEDSDFFRSRWRGLFPAQGNTQFINSEDVNVAMLRPAMYDATANCAIGVDVARFGDDSSVLYPRIGRDAKTHAPERYKGISTVDLVSRVISMVQRFRMLGYENPYIFVDGTGVGGGVVDQLRALGYNVIEVQFAAKPLDAQMYRFKSDELWGKLRDALKAGLALPSCDSPDGSILFEQMTQREYGHTLKGQIHLETKADMKARGVPSPDDTDALALTFAQDIAPRQLAGPSNAQNQSANSDYDPIGEQAFTW